MLITVGALALAGLALYLGFEFVRRAGPRGAVAVVIAALAHGALALWIPRLESPPPPPKPPPINVELIPRNEPPDPEPVPEAEAPVSAAEPETTREKPEPRRAPPKRRPPPSSSAPADTEPAGPKRFDLSQLNSGPSSGVTVVAGEPGGVPGGMGKGKGTGGVNNGAGTSPGPPAASKAAPADGRGWEPAAEVFVRRLPVPLRVRKHECPKTREGVEGTVVLKVQIRRDGTVRRARVVKGIDPTCDRVALGALRSAKFKPALVGNNQPADFEIRYEYAFKLSR